MPALKNATPTSGDRFLRMTGSPEIFLKSRPTRVRFLRMLLSNTESALARDGVKGKVRRTGLHEMRVDADDLAAAANTLGNVFGIGKITVVDSVAYHSLANLAETVVEAARDRVAGRTFAVRVKRRGSQDWTSLDADRLIGRMLLDDSAGVDLDDPQETVRVHVTEDTALIVRSGSSGPNGLPLGSQEPALALLSGGIDSPVAAWMLMRTGCPVDFLHLEMECSVTDQALAVGHELVARWGHGTRPRFHVADFQPIKKALLDRVDPRLRQVVLKQLMLTAGEQIARRLDLPMLVTGDSLGQVSSQTAAHLVQIDGSVNIPVIRPLVALRKDEIIERARQIGTYDLSILTREVCDLSDGNRVATRASTRSLERAGSEIGPELMEDVLASVGSVEARRWTPGMPIEPAA